MKSHHYLGVAIDDDLNGDNGFVRADSGTSGSGTTVNYTIKDVSAGTYYIYAVVFVTSGGRKGPQSGDYLGIYGGSFTDVLTKVEIALPAPGRPRSEDELVRAHGRRFLKVKRG